MLYFSLSGYCDCRWRFADNISQNEELDKTIVAYRTQEMFFLDFLLDKIAWFRIN